MPSVLTTGSTILCDKPIGGHHGAKVTTTSTAKLTVGGKAVLVATSLRTIPAASVPPAPCANQPALGETKCTGVLTTTAGLARKLTAGGNPVLLETLKGATNGVPPGTLSAVATQVKLTAV